MSRTAGIRQVVAAVIIRFGVSRIVAARGREALWEERIAAVRRWGEDA